MTRGVHTAWQQGRHLCLNVGQAGRGWAPAEARSRNGSCRVAGQRLPHSAEHARPARPCIEPPGRACTQRRMGHAQRTCVGAATGTAPARAWCRRRARRARRWWTGASGAQEQPLCSRGAPQRSAGSTGRMLFHGRPCSDRRGYLCCAPVAGSVCGRALVTRHACQRSSSRLHTSAPLRSRLAAVLAKPRTPCTAVRAGHAGRARCSTARHAPRGCEGATAAAAAPGRPRSLSMRLRTRRPRTARCRRRRATSRPCSSRRAPAGVNPGISYCLRSCRRLHP